MPSDDARRGPRRVGQWVERHWSLPSTNDRALELARRGAASGWVVVSETQTSGKGQRGAVWRSPAGGGLYASFLLRPSLEPQLAGLLTLAAGVATHDALDRFVPGAVGLKWPNDILARAGSAAGAKLSGILVEATGDAQGLAHAVVGIGVNLSGPPQVEGRRTVSLRQLGQAPDRESLLDALGAELERQLDRLEAGDAAGVIDAWQTRALGLGEPAEIVDGERTLTGRLEGLDASGGAIFRLDDGPTRTFHHGRVRLAIEGRAPGITP